MEHPLKRQLAHALRGEFAEAWELSEQMERDIPYCNRAAFNRGLYLLQRGRFQEGNEYLCRGRNENVFGNRHPGTGAPIWQGESDLVVILSLEGGLGDQIHGMRFIKEIVAAGSSVVVACDPALAMLIKQIEGVSAICSNEVLSGVYHDAWLPAMSAGHYMNHTGAKGETYIPRTADPVPGRIGIRWSGNPEFEHQQHRRFPIDLMFNAVEGAGEIVSLQRDGEADLKPSWIEQANVNTWIDTQRSISECEKVITSCTSVAHLSAAMGVETWIIVPILPYYLWAVPGAKTDHYDSVTLFRQETPDDWTAPFEAVQKALADREEKAA